jgi:hypothetical protein
MWAIILPIIILLFNIFILKYILHTSYFKNTEDHFFQRFKTIITFKHYKLINRKYSVLIL